MGLTGLGAQEPNSTAEDFDFMAAMQSGLGFLDSSENSLPPPPPSLEVLPSEVSSSVTFTMEPVHLSGCTLLMGRVSTQEIFHLSNSDFGPAKYEGGLKL
ncbi:hypothetical protein LOK49_LG08G02759 [Camellia lanceoleosa]|uniref:Uncharacterized protein n=1 Tax=Camellia lanceoleosa TaxID=1840588 RepID=A0ACC0GNR0_9ERIC|nr:hypothetical protein LOK49_LG08G02759 [Camellia lanceoleosa]